MVDAHGQLKVLDIGLAQLIDPEQDARSAIEAEIDDVDFLAPEQATGKNKVDQRADVYALGCCLFYLLSGEVPYPEGDTQSRIRARVRKTPIDVRKVRSDTPDALAEVCAKMMTTQPRERVTGQKACRVLEAWLKENRSAPELVATEAAPDATSESDFDNEDPLAGLADLETDNRTTGPQLQFNSPLELTNTSVEEGIDNRTWVIAAASGAVLLLLLLAGFVGYFLFAGRSEPSTAEKNEAKNDSQERARTTLRMSPGAGEVPAKVGKTRTGTARQNKGAWKPGSRSAKDERRGGTSTKVAAPPGAGMSTLAHWRFDGDGKKDYPVKNQEDDRDDPSVKDISGNGYHLYCLRPSVAPRFTDDVARKPFYLNGATRPNNLSLDDTEPSAPGEPPRHLKTADVVAGESANLGTRQLDQWTVEASFQLPSVDQEATIIGKDGPSTSKNGSFALRVSPSDGGIAVIAVDRIRMPRRVVSGNALELQEGVWYHVAAVCDGKQLRLHVATDDSDEYQLLATDAFEGSLVSHDGVWTVGCGMAKGEPVDDAVAIIDEVRISSTALDVAEFLFSPSQVQFVASQAATNSAGDGGGNEGDAVNGSVRANTGEPYRFEDLEVVKTRITDHELHTINGSLQEHSSGDGSYVVTGKVDKQIVFEVIAKPTGSFPSASGFLLEVLPDASGRVHDLGSQPNGEFAVTHLVVSRREGKNGNWREIPRSGFSAEASAERAELPARDAIDGKTVSTGWTVPIDHLGKPHWLLLGTDNAAAISLKPETQFKFEIHQRRDYHAIKRFRLALRTGSSSGPGAQTPSDRILAARRKANPFELVDNNISLPGIGSNGSVDLGKVYVGEDDQINVTVAGGATGHGGTGAFTIAPQESSEGKAIWKIRYAPAEGDAVAIAAINLAGENLTIGWLPEAASVEDAARLMNCAIRFEARELQAAVGLRKSIKLDPLKLAISENGVRPEPFSREIDAPPDTESIRIQLRLNEDDFGTHEFADGKSAMPVDDGELEIKLGHAGNLQWRIMSKYSRDTVQLAMAQMYQLPEDAKQRKKTTKFNFAAMNGEYLRMSKLTTEAEPKLARMKKILGYKKPNKPERYELATISGWFKKNFRTFETKEIEEILQRIRKKQGEYSSALSVIENLIERFGSKVAHGEEKPSAPIEFRIYRDMGDAQVNLYQSQGWATPDEPGG